MNTNDEKTQAPAAPAEVEAAGSVGDEPKPTAGLEVGSAADDAFGGNDEGPRPTVDEAPEESPELWEEETRGGSLQPLLVGLLLVLTAWFLLSMQHAQKFTVRSLGDDTALTLAKGRFLPWGYTPWAPEGAGDLFPPLALTDNSTPSPHAPGSMEDAVDNYYLVLLAQAETAQESPQRFRALSQQAAGIETWMRTTVGRPPAAFSRMEALRNRVASIVLARLQVVEICEGMQGLLVDLPPELPMDLQRAAAQVRDILSAGQLCGEAVGPGVETTHPQEPARSEPTSPEADPQEAAIESP